MRSITEKITFPIPLDMQGKGCALFNIRGKCMVLIPVSLVVHVVGFYVMLLHLIALGNSVRIYPGIVQGLTFYLYKDK